MFKTTLYDPRKRLFLKNLLGLTGFLYLPTSSFELNHQHLEAPIDWSCSFEYFGPEFNHNALNVAQDIATYREHIKNVKFIDVELPGYFFFCEKRVDSHFLAHAIAGQLKIKNPYSSLKILKPKDFHETIFQFRGNTPKLYQEISSQYDTIILVHYEDFTLFPQAKLYFSQLIQHLRINNKILITVGTEGHRVWHDLPKLEQCQLKALTHLHVYQSSQDYNLSQQMEFFSKLKKNYENHTS